MTVRKILETRFYPSIRREIEEDSPVWHTSIYAHTDVFIHRKLSVEATLCDVYPFCIRFSPERQSFDVNKFELSFNRLEIEIPTKEKPPRGWNNTFHFIRYRISIDGLLSLPFFLFFFPFSFFFPPIFFIAKPFMRSHLIKVALIEGCGNEDGAIVTSPTPLQLAHAVAKEATQGEGISPAHPLQSVEIIASQLLS